MGAFKFRGKRKDNGKWEKGCLVKDYTGRVYIGFLSNYSLDGVEVIPETVGQFTGLCDFDGREIYEGDILQVRTAPEIVFQIMWGKEVGGFVCRDGRGQLCIIDYNPDNLIVIGNIHDNPELLKDTNISDK